MFYSLITFHLSEFSGVDWSYLSRLSILSASFTGSLRFPFFRLFENISSNNFFMAAKKILLLLLFEDCQF